MQSTHADITWLYWVTTPIGLGMLAFIIWQSRKPSTNSNMAWMVYDNLKVALSDLMHTEDAIERSGVYSRIENERGKLPDKGLDAIINPFLAAEAEGKRYGVTPYFEPSEKIMSLVFERMRNYIKGKYGGRN